MARAKDTKSTKRNSESSRDCSKRTATKRTNSTTKDCN